MALRPFFVSLAIVLSLGVPVAAQEAEPGEPQLKVGGALRTNLLFRTWDDASAVRPQLGLWAFDTFRLNADGGYRGLDFSAEYRLYAGYQMLHHGWVGYTWPSALQLQAGVHRVPFGLLPFASHNWFFQLPYYMGFEDDYDLGFKLLAPTRVLGLPLDVQLAFYKNDEGSFTGASLDSARYSYDVVRTGPGELAYAGVAAPQANEESNQANLRVAAAWPHGPIGRSELGASGQVGGLYNRLSGRYGWRGAVAAHLEGDYFDRYNLKAEVIRYGFFPANPAGESDAFVSMGAYDAPYKVAARGTLWALGLAYRLPVEAGPFSELLFYENGSWLLKDDPGFAPTLMNVLGVRATAGPLLIYADVASGRNHPWLGPDYGLALAEGRPDAPWHTRFNVNVGYYF